MKQSDNPLDKPVEDKKSKDAVMKVAEKVNRTGAGDGEADPESGSNQVVGVNRVDADDPDLPAGDKPAAQKEPGKASKKSG